jgi:hypothetical protein
MNNADIYRAVILRATYGPGYNIAKVADLKQLNRICEHLAECEEAQRILKRKGYGKAGMTFTELAASIPEHVCGLLRGLFRSSSTKSSEDRAKMDEAFDIWTSR